MVYARWTGENWVDLDNSLTFSFKEFKDNTLKKESFFLLVTVFCVRMFVVKLIWQKKRCVITVGQLKQQCMMGYIAWVVYIYSFISLINCWVNVQIHSMLYLYFVSCGEPVFVFVPTGLKNAPAALLVQSINGPPTRQIPHLRQSWVLTVSHL